MDYEISIDTYKGPIDKLLELVEEKQLEITEISLAAVTADFLKYVEKLGKRVGEKEKGGAVFAVEPLILADFLVVASKLILIKSKTILPTLELTEEEASDIRDLELRLKLYQELKAPQRFIKEIWSPFPKSFGREFLKGLGPVFYPPKKLKADSLVESLKKLLLVLEKTLKPFQTIKTEVINLKKKIEEIMARIGKGPAKLHELGRSGTRSEMVVMFLAILHLIREQLILVDQVDHFEDIKIARREKGA